MRATPLALAALALVALAALAPAAEAAVNGSQYLEGTRDPANRAWWYAALAALVLVMLAALWLLRVIPR